MFKTGISFYMLIVFNGSPIIPVNNTKITQKKAETEKH